MGSGLILLVIIGAWLVVLVPMVLRSHESSAAQNTVDKFHDAMRVLSRRSPSPDPDEVPEEEDEAAAPGTSRRVARSVGAATVARATAQAATARAATAQVAAARMSGAQVAAASAGPALDDPDSTRPAARRPAPARPATARPATARSVAEPEPMPSGLPASTRRRILLALLVAALLTVIGAMMGPVWLWAPQAVVDLLVVGFVVHCRLMTLRRQRERRAARERRRAADLRRASRRQTAAQSAQAVQAVQAVQPVPSAASAHPAADVHRGAPPGGRSRETVARPTRPLRVAGVPDRMPSRYTVLGTPLPQPAVVEEDVVDAPARGAQGAAWLPVPVPPPIYLSAPTAHPRPRSRAAAEQTDGVAAAERSLGIDDQGPELGQILRRRKAVND